MSVDYDVRRQSDEAKVEDSLKEFEFRAETSSVAVLDEEETPNEREQNPWVLESNEELRVRVVPEQHDEFTCTSCFLVHHRSQLVEVGNGLVCSDCDGFRSLPGPAEGVNIMAKKQGDPGPSVKDKGLYEELRDEGESKEKAARIANQAASSSRKKVGKSGGTSPSYDDWRVDELRKRASELGISGRSTMNKSTLISALRNH